MSCCYRFPHEKTWADEKFGCVKRNGKRGLRFGGIKIAHALKVEHDYREDLARSQVEIAQDPERPRWWRPGMKDPEAYVDGPVAVKKLLDKRKRQGWVEDSDMYAKAAKGNTDDNIRSDDNLIEKAYEMAKAEGFKLEGE